MKEENFNKSIEFLQELKNLIDKYGIKLDSSWSPCYHGDGEATFNGFDLICDNDYITSISEYEIMFIDNVINNLNRQKQWIEFEDSND